MKVKVLSPKSKGQEIYQQVLDDRRYNKILTLGSSGSGKTAFACQTIAKDYLEGKIDKIVLIRSLEPVEGEDSVGWLPGVASEKLLFWMQPILFHLKKHLPVNKMIADGEIEFFPLEMLRGTSFESDLGIAVIATEIQNIGIPAFKCLLTRMGRNSRLYMDGDCDQGDRGHEHTDNFLDIVSELDAKVDKFKLVTMTKADVFRDKHIRKILEVFEDFEY